jgi:uncharacterized protein YtpQ (UPF0354 family)
MKILITLLLFLLSTAAAAEKMSEIEFTKYFALQAKLVLKGVELKVDEPLQLSSKNINGWQSTIFLNNAYNQYSSNNASLPSIIESQVKSLDAQNRLGTSKAGSSIFAVIKPSDYLDNVRMQLSKAGLGDKDMPLIYEKLNEDLYVFYVFDSESGMQMITKNDLAELNVDESDVRLMARNNLDQYFEKSGLKIQRLDKTGEAKVYKVTLDDNYEASILLLSKYWTKKYFEVNGNIVAFIPARNVVVVTGSADVEGMLIAGYLAENGFKELGYAISPKGYKFESGAWVH